MIFVDNMDDIYWQFLNHCIPQYECKKSAFQNLSTSNKNFIYKVIIISIPANWCTMRTPWAIYILQRF